MSEDKIMRTWAASAHNTLTTAAALAQHGARDLKACEASMKEIRSAVFALRLMSQRHAMDADNARDVVERIAGEVTQ